MHACDDDRRSIGCCALSRSAYATRQSSAASPVLIRFALPSLYASPCMGVHATPLLQGVLRLTNGILRIIFYG